MLFFHLIVISPRRRLKFKTLMISEAFAELILFILMTVVQGCVRCCFRKIKQIEEDIEMGVQKSC